MFGGEQGDQSCYMGPLHVEGTESFIQMHAGYILVDETANNEDGRHERHLDVPQAVSLHRPRLDPTHGPHRSP